MKLPKNLIIVVSIVFITLLTFLMLTYNKQSMTNLSSLHDFNQAVEKHYRNKSYTFTSEIKYSLTDNKGKPVHIENTSYILQGSGYYVFNIQDKSFRKEQNLKYFKGNPVTNLNIENHAEKYLLLENEGKAAFVQIKRFKGNAQGYTNIITENIDGPSNEMIELDYRLVFNKIKEQNKDYYEIKTYSPSDSPSREIYHSRTLYDTNTLAPVKQEQIIYDSHETQEGLIETTYSDIKETKDIHAYDLVLPKNFQPLDVTQLRIDMFDIARECDLQHTTCLQNRNIWNIIPNAYKINGKTLQGSGSFFRTYGKYFPELDFKVYVSTFEFHDYPRARDANPNSLTWKEVEKVNDYQFHFTHSSYPKVRLDVYDKKNKKKLYEVYGVGNF